MALIKKLRQLNRRRNYLKKEIKYSLDLYFAARKWKKTSSQKPNRQDIKSILLVRNEGKIGDAIVSTCFLRALFEAGYRVDILAVKENESLFRHNPYIHNIYLSESFSDCHQRDKYDTAIGNEVVTLLRDNAYDLLIDTAIWQTALYMPKMIADINPKMTLGFNKPGWLKPYDINIQFDHLNNHVKNIYRAVLDYLQVETVDGLNYEIFYPERIDAEIHQSGMFSADEHNILINIYASHADRDLSEQQLNELIGAIVRHNAATNIVVLDHKGALEQASLHPAKLYRVPSLYHAFAAVKKSDCVITPDTAVVHISAAYNKALVGIYQDSLKNNQLWSPGYSNGHQIFSDEFVFKNDGRLVEKISQKIHTLVQP
ncbi:glycosyltransferase family 9 protein [Pantoea sp. Pa-EAmG]|uniref:glycosyltransferase family 9 protein n=1 Tax=Pantoea sp. Pa-EAmG TaxID=3043311 RepID=UPI0024AFEB56|nr:glycosyltransferase family 9 protein [Pantoea sp. Pa-EAmG]MDI6955189.1 glycosyltransferase family 9 protein [Pantoea sp. Pa-EAmG]